jgi:hypothetical protein
VTRDTLPRAITSLVCLAAFSACAVNSAPALSSQRFADATPNGAARPSEEAVGGVIKTSAWRVPKGETWSVEGRGLTVIAKSEIEIAGTLLVKPGTRIAFFAPTFVLSGRIYIPKNLATNLPLRSAQPAANDVISACAASIGAGPGDSPGYVQLVIPFGDNLYVTAPSKSCNLRENGIALLAGSPGNIAVAGLQDGAAGGDLEIGTATAIAAAKRAAREAGDVVQAYAPASVEFDTNILGARGGAGATDAAGVQASPGTWTFRPGNGGHGGNVIVETTVASIVPAGSSFALFAGSGGSGGGIGGVGAPSLDGTASAPNAGNLTIVQSSGANGGSASIKALYVSGGLVTIGGDGGTPGNVSYAGGNGFAGSISSIGNGGGVALAVARAGTGGAGETKGVDAVFPEMSFSGGTGATPDNGLGLGTVAGGKGGSFTLSLKPGAPPLPSGVSVLLDAFGTGGYGAGSCGSAAFSGGSGGSLFDAQKIPFELQNGSFDGGDGGSGTPPGLGGSGGTFGLTQIGANGLAGKQC